MPDSQSQYSRPSDAKAPKSLNSASTQNFTLLSSCLAVLILWLLPTGPAAADDWPQWRGPNRDGKSAETGLLSSWPDGGPPLTWQAQGVGLGYSSVTTKGDRIFTMGDIGEQQYVLAVNAKAGKVLWKTPIDKSWDHQFVGARSTPTLDDDRVYALSTEGKLVCLNQADGNIVWQRRLPKDFGARLMTTESGNSWKFSESPLVDGDQVVVTPGIPGALLVALNKSSGKEIWRTKVDSLYGDDSSREAFNQFGLDGAGYSSIVISHAAGVRQYVQLLGRGVIGVDSRTGKLLWHYGRVANAVANIATPLVEDDLVFSSTGYGTGSALLEIRRKGDALSAVERYFLNADTMQNHHGELILHRDHVFTGTGHNKGFPLSVELESGEVAWGPVRNEGRSSAAIIYADERLYFRYQNGLMVLIEATPAGYQERGSFQIPDVDQFSWSQPVIANGRLYLREQDNLFAYDIQAKPVKAAEPGR